MTSKSDGTKGADALCFHARIYTQQKMVQTDAKSNGEERASAITADPVNVSSTGEASSSAALNGEDEDREEQEEGLEVTAVDARVEQELKDEEAEPLDVAARAPPHVPPSSEPLQTALREASQVQPPCSPCCYVFSFL